MANLAKLQHSPEPIERAAYWIVDYSWTGIADFEEMQQLSKELQDRAYQFKKLKSFVEDIAEHRGIYSVTDEQYICGHCGLRWSKDEQDFHYDKCIVKMARDALTII